MKDLNNYINERLNPRHLGNIYRPGSKKELQKLLDKLIDERGQEGDFNDIDTSLITDMSYLFLGCYKFNGDISKWNTSRVTNMEGMFENAKIFDRPIGKWDTSRVVDMSRMFLFAEKFNQDLSDWDVKKVTNMSEMFCFAEKFNQDLSNWNVNPSISKAAIRDMFNNCPIPAGSEPEWWKDRMYK